MLPTRMAIYAATAPIDLRRAFDGLAAAAREQLGHDPKSGALFLFVNKTGDRLKALWWDRTGYCLLCKRLERGRFRIPALLRPGDKTIALDAAEFARILEGLDLPRSKVAVGVAAVRRPAPPPAASP
jgi:transposase